MVEKALIWVLGSYVWSRVIRIVAFQIVRPLIVILAYTTCCRPRTSVTNPEREDSSILGDSILDSR